MPVEKYFIGTLLPPHLSPFTVDYRTQRYVPPEEEALTDPSVIVNKGNVFYHDIPNYYSYLLINFLFPVDQDLLDEISDNDIEDIEDTKIDSEDDIMDAEEDDELDEFDGEMTEEKLAEIKVIILNYYYIYLYYNIIVCYLA